MKAFGKVILLGEHAVVHGHPALAAALGRGVSARAARRERGPSTLAVDGWDLRVTGTDDEAPAVEAFSRVLSHFDGAFAVTAASDLPPGAGLGSSAALAVAVARALAAATEADLDDDAIARIANDAERVFHDNPSGVDVALASRGGVGVYRRGEGLSPIEAPPIPLAVGLSGEPRTTAAMVRRVAAHLERNRPALAALGEAARAGAEAARSGDAAALGRLFDDAHEHLRAIEVSTETLDRLAAIARDAGALGAKLTGAGGGGAVIAIAPGREVAVCEAWRAAGFEAFACDAGGPR